MLSSETQTCDATARHWIDSPILHKDVMATSEVNKANHHHKAHRGGAALRGGLPLQFRHCYAKRSECVFIYHPCNALRQVTSQDTHIGCLAQTCSERTQYKAEPMALMATGRGRHLMRSGVLGPIPLGGNIGRSSTRQALPETPEAHFPSTLPPEINAVVFLEGVN